MTGNNIEDNLYGACVTILATTFAVTLLLRSKRRRLCREPSHGRSEIREQYLSRLIDGNATNSIKMVRMNKSTFFNLCSIMRRKGLMRDTLHITIKEQLLMFLHTIGHNQRNRVIAHNFLRSSETISRYFNHVLYAIGQLRDEYVCPPGTQTSTYIAPGSTLYPYFKVLNKCFYSNNLLSHNFLLVIIC